MNETLYEKKCLSCRIMFWGDYRMRKCNDCVPSRRFRDQPKKEV